MVLDLYQSYIHWFEESALSTMAEATQLVCKHCGSSNFASRNKLFSHLKSCLINRNPCNHTRQPEEDFLSQNHAFLYVCGGRIRGKTLGFVERYDFATQTWSKMPSLLENRGSHVSVSVDNYVYVIGGGGFRSNLDSIERIDVLTSEIVKLASMPVSRHALTAVVMGRSIYTVGGWIGGSKSSTDLEKYDIDSNSWVSLANMPTGRRLLGACVHGHCIYTFGGYIGDAEGWKTNATEVYDSLTNTWRVCDGVPIPGQCSAVRIHEHIYVFVHGYGVYRFDPVAYTYTLLTTSYPLSQWFCFDVCVCNDLIYLVGGNVEGVWSSYMYSYDVYGDVWTACTSMGKARRRCSASVVVLSKTV